MPKFSLTVTLGYGCERQIQEELNNLTTPKKDGEDTKVGGSGISGFFTRQKTSNNKNGKIFVASASHVNLSLQKTQASSPSSSSPSSTISAIPSSPILAAIFIPPSMIERRIEKLFSSQKTLSSYQQRQQQHTGSCFWIPDSAANKLAQELLPKVHASLGSTTTNSATTNNNNNNNNRTKIRGIIRTTILASKEDNAPADILLVDICNTIHLGEILSRTNGQNLVEEVNAILKVLPIETIQFFSDDDTTTTNQHQQQHHQFPNSSSITASIPSSSTTLSLVIPTCPVCLYRIDPIRLGLPSSKELCSKYCPAPTDLYSSSSNNNNNNNICPKQRFLLPWPFPSRCKPCQIIQTFWKYPNDGTIYKTDTTTTSGVEETKTNLHDDTDGDDLLFCGECAMHKTLWVCLTCGFVGCGRYSNQHSVEHFQQTSHPFALELATLRIWDYVHGQFGGYAHRVDLLECPSSPVTYVLSRSQTTIGGAATITTSSNGNFATSSASTATAASISRSASAAAAAAGRSQDVMTNNSRDSSHDLKPTAAAPMSNNYHATSDNFAHGMYYGNDEKNPKKATMIGHEYEALLQSALEDQAQHYEGEISRLRAQLTSPLLDEASLSPKEQEEIQALNKEIQALQDDIEATSRELLDAQAVETTLRARSQTLLKECQSLREEMTEIEKQTKQENEWGRLQVEDLEQQVGDLTANLRMRQQFSQSEELSRAQIFGTSEQQQQQQQQQQNRKGKKKGRFFRR